METTIEEFLTDRFIFAVKIPHWFWRFDLHYTGNDTMHTPAHSQDISPLSPLHPLYLHPPRRLDELSPLVGAVQMKNDLSLSILSPIRALTSKINQRTQVIYYKIIITPSLSTLAFSKSPFYPSKKPNPKILFSPPLHPPSLPPF